MGEHQCWTLPQVSVDQSSGLNVALYVSHLRGAPGRELRFGPRSRSHKL